MSNVEGEAKLAAELGVVKGAKSQANDLLIELRAKVADQPLAQFSDVGRTLIAAIEFLLERYVVED